MLTKQEIFDHVASHLLKQKKRALNFLSTCVYRTEDGLMCAVGSLIPESAYNPDIEGMTIDRINSGFGDDYWGDTSSGVRALLLMNTLLGSGVDVNDVAIRDLLKALQYLHDEVDALKWPSALEGVAFYHQLNTDVVKSYV